MEPSKADLIAKVYFYNTCDGGRKAPTPPDKFGCLVKLKKEGKRHFDCQLLLHQTGSIKPGDTVTIPIIFLYPDVKSKFRKGQKFFLRELSIIGEGIVEEILPNEFC